MFYLFTSDLHSRKTHYEELYNLYRSNKFDAIIIGGDLFKYTHDKNEQLRFINDYLRDFLSLISIPIIILPGNADWPVSMRKLEKLEIANVKVISHKKYINLNGIKHIGYEYVTPHPFSQKHRTKRDLRKDDFIIDTESYTTDDQGNVIKVYEEYAVKQDIKNKQVN